VLKQRHQIFVALLGAADAVVILVAALASWAARRWFVEGDLPTFGAAWFRESLSIFVLAAAMACMWGFRLYRPWRDRSFSGECVQIVKASLSTVVALIVLVWLIGPETLGAWSAPGAGLAELDAGRTQLIALAILLPVLLGVERGVFRFGLRSLRRRGWNLRHVAIVGTGRLGRIVCRTLDRNSWTGIHVAYFISHHEHASPGAMCVNRPVLGGMADLERLMESRKPDAVYLAIPTARAALVPALLKRLERFALEVRLVPDVHPRFMPNSMSISELEGMPILSVRECPLHGLGGAAKRTLDLAGALAAIIIFSPIMIAVAIMVRLTSPGPVIFRQRRVSLGGEEFNIYKFRTMYHAEDEQTPATWTQRNDPRVTPVGQWLRRTSLDELPQLFNVLRGQMSLVGPRPERPELIVRFRDDWRGYMLRQHVKAGITGWAQVNGLRGDTSLRKRLQLDLFYVRHWSLGFDIKILWLTLFRGFVHKNAH
jgi:Undecaprenyl-phosphate glucose phosphotransferase